MPNVRDTRPRCSMTLDDRQLATVLAALRFWQESCAPTDQADDDAVLLLVPRALHDHFDEHEPLSEGEIDALCEQLNGERD